MNNVAEDNEGRGQKDETCFRHSKMLENIEEAFDTGPVCFLGGEQRDWQLQLAPERARHHCSLHSLPHTVPHQVYCFVRSAYFLMKKQKNTLTPPILTSILKTQVSSGGGSDPSGFCPRIRPGAAQRHKLQKVSASLRQRKNEGLKSTAAACYMVRISRRL